MSGTAHDGSPVELYARLPSLGEPEIVHDAIPPGAEILELGAGAGRMTHRLLELGHAVTAVDSSAEMLAHIRGATTVQADIVGLDLGRTFDCVLLASQLINVDDDLERAGFLAACARHVAPNGVVVVQRYAPAWADDPRSSDTVTDGLRIHVIHPHREGERLHATVEYELGGRRWTHGPFSSRILTDAELAARLGVAGLDFERWLDDQRSWLLGTPADDLSALYVEIPAAEPAVRDLRLRWDAAGTAVPAHVTVLFPFLPPRSIDASVDAELSAIASTLEPFQVRFERVGRFPEVVWLAPDPVEPFRRLTDAVAARWPDHPPYGGAFAEVVHHLTVADGAPPDVLDRLEMEMGTLPPIVEPVRALTLAVRHRGMWSERGRYSLGAVTR